jgi:hypothetical protein
MRGPFVWARFLPNYLTGDWLSFPWIEFPTAQAHCFLATDTL